MSDSYDFEPSSAQSPRSSRPQRSGLATTVPEDNVASDAQAPDLQHESHEHPLSNSAATLPQDPGSGRSEPQPQHADLPGPRNRSQTVQYDDRRHPLNSPVSPVNPNRLRRSGTDVYHALSEQGRRTSALSASGFSVNQRPKRSDTVKTYHQPTQPNWEPGAEPGIDTSEGAHNGKLHEVHEVP